MIQRGIAKQRRAVLIKQEWPTHMAQQKTIFGGPAASLISPPPLVWAPHIRRGWSWVIADGVQASKKKGSLNTKTEADRCVNCGEIRVCGGSKQDFCVTTQRNKRGVKKEWRAQRKVGV